MCQMIYVAFNRQPTDTYLIAIDVLRMGSFLTKMSSQWVGHNLILGEWTVFHATPKPVFMNYFFAALYSY